MKKFLKSIVFCGALAAILSTQQSCSDAEMAGAGASAQKSKKKPTAGIDDPTSSAGSSACVDPSAAANPGQSIDLELSGFSPTSSVSVQDNFGTATINGTVLTYRAPASVPDSRDVILTVTDGSNSKNCTVKVIGEGKFLIPDDGTSRALKANVYQLVANSQSMAANFDGKNIQPISGLYMAPNVNVPSQPSNLGFPGMRTGVQTEDFVISFYGKIKIPKDGQYQFQVTVDDGAVMWIDSTKVINADGWANKVNVANRSHQGSIQLSQGEHPFKLNYYQGPKCCIAIILQWKKPGDSEFTVVPASVFDRPD